MLLKKKKRKKIKLKDITTKLNLKVKPMSNGKIKAKLREVLKKYKKCLTLG